MKKTRVTMLLAFRERLLNLGLRNEEAREFAHEFNELLDRWADEDDELKQGHKRDLIKMAAIGRAVGRARPRDDEAWYDGLLAMSLIDLGRAHPETAELSSKIAVLEFAVANKIENVEHAYHEWKNKQEVAAK